MGSRVLLGQSEPIQEQEIAKTPCGHTPCAGAGPIPMSTVMGDFSIATWYCPRVQQDHGGMAWLFLHHCDQIPNKQLKGGKVYFGLQFLRVQFMIGFTDSGPVVRQSIMVAERKSQGQDSPQGPALSDVLPPGYGDFGDDFNLEDALKETSSVKQRWDHFTTTRKPGTTRAPAHPAVNDFDLTDALGDRDDGRKKPSAGGRERWDHVTTTTTRRPGTTRAPANPDVNDFDLADALDDRNDQDDGRRKPSAGGGGGFSDKDLEDIVGGGGYKPDKNKGDGGYGSSDDPGSGMSAETGTIAGVASALAMALIGAVSSYISYQQKKFCFSIQHAAEGQEGLNADYVKGENLEAVVCEEPQVKCSALQTQSAEPPPQGVARI
ncbi:CD99 antigen-like protein 2 isoform X2 [Castor canadensis]|uniref:CD99 antigen-like protein 2 isoform X2 n=1 Tax=Castor canadensis TaxID=51338 RepID=A0AC58LMZ7_CASCN